MEFELKWLAWEITRRCNLKCVHCRSSSELEAKAHPDFSLEEGFRVLDDIASYASPVVVLSGGEPLLRKDVFELAERFFPKPVIPSRMARQIACLPLHLLVSR